MNWDVTINGYRLFRWDRGGTRDRGVALYLKRWIECDEKLMVSTTGPWSRGTYWLTASSPAGGFQPLDICLERGTASFRQPKKLLECREDDFLRDVIDSTSSSDLMATNVDKLTELTKAGVSLCCSDHLLELAVLRDMAQLRNKVRPLNFRKENFHLFRDVAKGIPWEAAVRDKGEK